LKKSAQRVSWKAGSPGSQFSQPFQVGIAVYQLANSAQILPQHPRQERFGGDTDGHGQQLHGCFWEVQ